MPYDRAGHLRNDSRKHVRDANSSEQKLSQAVAAKKKVFKKVTHIEEIVEEEDRQEQIEVKKLQEHELDHAAHVCSEHCRYGEHYYPGYGYYPDCGQFGYPDCAPDYHGYGGDCHGGSVYTGGDPRYIHAQYSPYNSSHAAYSAHDSYPSAHYPSAHYPRGATRCSSRGNCHEY